MAYLRWDWRKCVDQLISLACMEQLIEGFEAVRNVHVYVPGHEKDHHELLVTT